MRFMRLVALLAIPAHVLLAQQAPATRGGPLTLDDAITIARQNNPSLAQTRNYVRNADATLKTMYGALLPSASASVGSSYTQGGTQYYQGVALGSTADSYNSNYRLGFNYTVAAGAVFAPKAGRASRAAAEANVTSATEGLRSSVTTQYIQTLEEQATAALNDTLVMTAKGQLDLANAKMEVGAGTILDVRTAEVALGQARVSALQSHNQAQIEKLKLFQLMGVPADTSAVLTTQFQIGKALPAVDELITMARRVNPDLLAKKSTQLADEANLKVAKSTYLPSLNLSTGVGGTAFGYASVDPLVTQAQTQAALSFGSCLSSDSIRVGAGLKARGCNSALSPAAVDAIRSNLQSSNKPFRFASTPLSFSVGISLPIFNNFQREANVENARVAHDNASFDLRSRDLQLATDVSTAYLNVVTAAQTIDLRTTTAAQATEALAFADESYKVGAKTFLDVTTARGQYEQALVARVNAIYDYHKAFAALESAVGRPLR
ncbi:MAG: TolC family protein [Gemmatimonadaceae bacterium]